MAYTLTYNHPHFPEGTEFGVGGLEEPLLNGSSIQLTEDMERGFIMVQGRTVEDAFSGNAVVELSGSSALNPDEVSSLLPVVEEVPASVLEPEPSVLEPEPVIEGGEESA